MKFPAFAVICALIITPAASAQHLPANAPSGMDPVSASFIEACNLYQREDVASARSYLERSNYSFYSQTEQVLDGLNTQFTNFTRNSAGNEELVMVLLVNTPEIPASKVCLLQVSENTDAENRFSPNSFDRLSEFDWISPAPDERAMGISDIWDREDNRHYTTITAGSEGGFWKVLISTTPSVASFQ